MSGGPGKPLRSTQPPSFLLLLWEFSHWFHGGQSETPEADPCYHLFTAPSDPGPVPAPHLLWGERAQRAEITVTC